MSWPAETRNRQRANLWLLLLTGLSLLAIGFIIGQIFRL